MRQNSSLRVSQSHDNHGAVAAEERGGPKAAHSLLRAPVRPLGALPGLGGAPPDRSRANPRVHDAVEAKSHI
eukprot:scaffold30058_cov29-Prasinocladus_malaysianus.AAC.2